VGLRGWNGGDGHSQTFAEGGYLCSGVGGLPAELAALFQQIVLRLPNTLIHPRQFVADRGRLIGGFRVSGSGRDTGRRPLPNADGDACDSPRGVVDGAGDFWNGWIEHVSGNLPDKYGSAYSTGNLNSRLGGVQ
jgi:hypothetical protein